MRFLLSILLIGFSIIANGQIKKNSLTGTALQNYDNKYLKIVRRFSFETGITNQKILSLPEAEVVRKKGEKSFTFYTIGFKINNALTLQYQKNNFLQEYQLGTFNQRSIKYDQPYSVVGYTDKALILNFKIIYDIIQRKGKSQIFEYYLGVGIKERYGGVRIAILDKDIIYTDFPQYETDYINIPSLGLCIRPKIECNFYKFLYLSGALEFSYYSSIYQEYRNAVTSEIHQNIPPIASSLDF